MGYVEAMLVTNGELRQLDRSIPNCAGSNNNKTELKRAASGERLLSGMSVASAK